MNIDRDMKLEQSSALARESCLNPDREPLTGLLEPKKESNCPGCSAVGRTAATSMGVAAARTRQD